MDALRSQFLEWLGSGPRDYRETMEAWRTSCPRLTVWEDALSEGLIERVPGRSLAESQIRVTETGLRRLAKDSRARPIRGGPGDEVAF